MITLLTYMTYEIVTEIVGVLDTPDWLLNWYNKVSDFWDKLI